MIALSGSLLRFEKNCNAYTLPDGNVLISFSGGRTSGYMLHKILEANGDLPERCKVVFANTGREMPETLDFVQECSERWRVPITWLEYRKQMPKFVTVSHNSASRDGEPFSQCIDSVTKFRYLPNQAQRFCTQQMKVLTIKRYLVRQGWKKWINTVGIRADENNRLRVSKDKRWSNWYPLNNATVSLHNIHSFWKDQPFDLRVEKGLGNCDGCFLKSEATLAAVWREHPERMQWWSSLETKVGAKFHKTRSYKDLGDFVQRQGDWIFDNKSYLCQSNDGECVA
mgnify:CR=1 FL=1